MAVAGTPSNLGKVGNASESIPIPSSNITHHPPQMLTQTLLVSNRRFLSTQLVDWATTSSNSRRWSHFPSSTPKSLSASTSPLLAVSSSTVPLVRVRRCSLELSLRVAALTVARSVSPNSIAPSSRD